MNNENVIPVRLPTVGSVVSCRIPFCDEDGGSLFSDNSINNVIQVTPEQAKQLEALEMSEQAITKTNLCVEVDPADPDPEATVEAVKQTYARGQRSEIAHIDEASFLKTDDVGPRGEPGLPGDDDSALATPITPRKHKRKKSKKKSGHLPNMNNRVVKAALGAAILGKLGAIQQKNTDAAKASLLVANTLSSVVEAVAGKELPAYQRRLMDLNQARAEGSLKPEIAEVLGTESPNVLKEAYDHLVDTSEEHGKRAEEIYPTLEEA